MSPRAFLKRADLGIDRFPVLESGLHQGDAFHHHLPPGRRNLLPVSGRFANDRDVRRESLFVIGDSGCIQGVTHGSCSRGQALISLHADPEKISEGPHLRERQLEGLVGDSLQRFLHPVRIVGLPDKGQSQVQILYRDLVPLYPFLLEVVQGARDIFL